MTLILLVLALWMFEPEPLPCKANPALTGKCFRVHGRLRAYNGNPTFRIWKIGTNRLLGVTGPHPGDPPILPATLPCGFDCDVIAGFEVCPFSPDRPGVMRRVCVESVQNPSALRRK